MIDFQGFLGGYIYEGTEQMKTMIDFRGFLEDMVVKNVEQNFTQSRI